MKTFTTIFITGLLSVLLPSAVLGQSSSGPFGDLVGKEISSDNIFMLWQQESGGDVLSYQKIIKYDMENDLLDIQDDVTRNFTDTFVGGSRQMVAASGNLNNDLYDDVVTAWQGLNGTIELYIPKFDSTEAMWNAASSHTITGPVTSEVNYLQGRILLEVADLNGSGRDEIIVVYKGEDQGIHLEVLGTDENLMPDLKDSLTVEQVYNTGYTHPPAALTIVDMDGDGNPEIVVASLINNGTDNKWALNLHRFEFNSNEELVQLDPIVTGIQDVSGLFNYTHIRFTLGSGKLIAGNSDQLLISMSYDALGAPGANDTFLYSYSYDQENNILISLDRDEFNLVNDSNGMDPMSIKTGDLDGDMLDEVMFSAEGRHHVIDIEENKFVEKFSVVQNSNKFGLSYDYLEVADINQDGIDEFIIAINRIGSGQDYFQLRAFSAYDKEDNQWLTSFGNVGQVLYHEYIPDGPAGPRRFAITAGSFDGYAFTLGEPIHYIDRENVQPIVILNAPPVHFDILNDTHYDINECYTESDCNFTAVYEEIETSSSEVSTEVKSDYGFSIGAGVSGSIETAPMGIGGSVNFEAYFDKTYGKNFSNTDTEGETISISVRTEAVEDDRIYATVTEYDVWEYPVYHGAEESPRKFTMAVEPRDVQSRWYSSKSWNASNYIPDHEVGNIFSYPSYSDVSGNPEVSQAVHYFSDTFELDANTNDSWSLDFESFTTTEADTTFKSGFDAKLDAIIRVKRDYTGSDISTHTTTVRDGLKINVSLGSIDRTIGENRFDVTPYAYWARNGALVVDYAASPERSGAGGTPTWWEEQYGQYADPAFILPWRYDPEKGFGISDELKRYQTKDIFFDFDRPEPGDTLTITAKVRNFSLVDASPVTVHFYVGDPDEGGELISGINGETSIITSEGIDAQRFEEVDLQWEVPSGLPSNPRIFAVLNQNSEGEEIHMNNNKGFNILGQSGVTVSNEPPIAETQPKTFKLHQAYPNPFNPTTTIGYELPQNTQVRLDVFNILGQRVATLVNDIQSTGFHEVKFDASNLSSGVYLYRLTTGQSVQSHKMILLK